MKEEGVIMPSGEKLNLANISVLLSIFIMVASPVTFLYMHKLDKAEFKEYRREIKTEIQETKKQVSTINQNVTWIRATMQAEGKK